MKPEQQMWQILSKAVGKYWDATRHEPPPRGIPDVSFGARGKNGWIELKTIDKWPSRPETGVYIEHCTPQQRVWGFRRGQYGGHTWLLLKVGQEWLLFNYIAAMHIGRGTLNTTETRRLAQKIWLGVPDPVEFTEAITQ